MTDSGEKAIITCILYVQAESIATGVQEETQHLNSTRTQLS